MEPEGSLPHSTELANCPCPKPDENCARPYPTSWTSILIASYPHITFFFQVDPFPQVSHQRNLRLLEGFLVKG